MNAKVTRRTARALVLASFGVATAGIALLLLSRTADVPPRFGFRGFPALFAIAFSSIGFLISTRRPVNLVGWTFLTVGVLGALQVFSEEYATYAYIAHQGSIPGGELFAWIQNWIWIPVVGISVNFLLLLFPEGQLLSKRWRPVAWFALLSTTVLTVGVAFTPGPLQNFSIVNNPLGWDRGGDAMRGITNAGYAMVGFSLSIAAMAQILRVRIARGMQRQQLKWFAAGATLAAAALISTIVDQLTGSRLQYQLSVVAIIAVALVPLTVGAAILRYRLYDLDIVINRTLVYGPLTAILAGVFAATIGVTQKAFVAATGQQSDAAIVITTLVVVSVFAPARTFIQSLVDRRFKQVHDPARELRAFTVHITSVFEAVEDQRIAESLLTRAVDGFDAEGGSVSLRRGTAFVVVARRGEIPAGDSVTVPLKAGGSEVGQLLLARRRDGKTYSDSDLRVLAEAASAAAQTVMLAPWKQAPE